MKKAIVTLCVGEPYFRLFTDYSRQTWEIYAKKHGYDLFVFDSFLDNSERGRSRPPHWQKLLALSDQRFAQYDRLVWIDSDIVIHAGLAPDIAEAVPDGLVGVVSDLSSPTWAESRVIANVMPSSGEIGSIHDNGLTSRLEEARRLMFRQKRGPAFLTPELRRKEFAADLAKHGIQTDALVLFNSGVMVTSPGRHADFFRMIYDKYENIFQPFNDNIPLIIEVCKGNIIHSIDSRFNVLFLLEFLENYPFLLFPSREAAAILKLAVSTIYLRSFFLHFAASYAYIPFVDTSVEHWLDFMRFGLPGQLVWPDRTVEQNRFLANAAEYPDLCPTLGDLDRPPPPLETNYSYRYNLNITDVSLTDDEKIVPFDYRMSVVGFYDPEILASGRVVRWTGKSSYCAFSVDAAGGSYAEFLLLIKHEGATGIAAGTQISVNGIPCTNLLVRPANIYPAYFSGDEYLLIEGRLPEELQGPLIFRIRHPYVTAVRDTPSPDTRRLGLAFTRLILRTNQRKVSRHHGLPRTHKDGE